MPRSLPRNWRNAPRGDFETLCSICGVAWQRSKLVRKADGLLYCPDDKDGRDAVTLSRLNAARIPRLHHIPQDGGGFESRAYEAIAPVGVFDDTFDESFA